MITGVATSSVNSMGFFIAAVVDFSDLVLFCRLFPVLACFGTFAGVHENLLGVALSPSESSPYTNPCM